MDKPVIKTQEELESKLLEDYPLFFLEMLDWQESFVRCKSKTGKTPRRRLAELGNKGGKCLTFETLINTPSGEIPVGVLFERGEPFEVYAWDGNKKIIAQASAPFKKSGLHKCFKFIMSDGQWFEAADYHRILTTDGWISSLDLSDTYLKNLHQTNSGCDRIVLPSGVLRLNQKPLDCRDNSPFVKDCNKINSITLIPELQEVFDFEVKKYHNYFAGGLIHHNTEIGLAEDIAHALGYRPWLDEDDPDYKIDIKVPNQGLIGCETMMHSVPQKIEPTLKRLIPKMCKPYFKPGPTGVCIRVVLKYNTNGKKCDSVIHIRSYDQRPDTFEGVDFEWIHWDEPPPEEIFKAAERGKVSTNAPSWFTMTPLKEPYIYDQFSLKAGIDPEIWKIRGEIWENCRNWCHKCKIDISENDEERILRNCPKCGRALGFIPKLGITEYLKNLDSDEKEAREKGIWKHLSGLVYKELDRDIHIYNDFNIPKNWMFIEGVDPHDARPVHWVFGAVSPEEIEIFGRQRNRIYFFDSLLISGDLTEIVRQVKAKRAFHGYKEPRKVILDAKFGVKTQIEHKSWESELISHGIKYIELSHSNPGDVGLGHKIVKEYLKMHYSISLGKEKPGMLFAKDGCGGDKGVIQSMFNYQWKAKSAKDIPEEKFKDFADCVRYVAMEEPWYQVPDEDIVVLETGSWMTA